MIRFGLGWLSRRRRHELRRRKELLAAGDQDFAQIHIGDDG
jgi:hypothetical protein